MTNNSSVFVDSTAPEGFIKSRVDASKRNRARRSKTTTVISALRTEFREVNSNSSTVTEGMGNKAPGGFNTFRSFHAVLNDEHGTTDGKA